MEPHKEAAIKFKPQFHAPANYKKPESIAAYIAEREASWFAEDAATMPITGNIRKWVLQSSDVEPGVYLEGDNGVSLVQEVLKIADPRVLTPDFTPIFAGIDIHKIMQVAAWSCWRDKASVPFLLTRGLNRFDPFAGLQLPTDFDLAFVAVNVIDFPYDKHSERGIAAYRAALSNHITNSIREWCGNTLELLLLK